MPARGDYPQVEVADRTGLRRWLEHHHADAGVHWLVTSKKCAGDRYLAYNVIVEELLCFGWIDSLPRALDATRTMVLISPRQRGSGWSAANRERIARLEAAGELAAAGAAAVAAARADGSWDRLAASDSGKAPPDLAAALDAAGAAACWKAFSLSVRRRALEYLLSAKRPQTRHQRLEKIVAATLDGIDPTAWKPQAS